MSGIVGYLLSTSVVAAIAIVPLAELGQQVAENFQMIANALAAAGAQ